MDAEQQTAESLLVHEATEHEGWEILEAQTQKRLHISAEEFIANWDAGVYSNCQENPEVLRLAMLLPLVRR